MKTIETKEDLIEFIEMSQNIDHIAKVMDAIYNAKLVLFENDTLNDVKNKVLDWIEKFGDNKEVPLFINHKELFK